MTLSELEWRLLYHSNLLNQESHKQSNASLIEILAPLPKQRSKRRPTTKARGWKRV